MSKPDKPFEYDFDELEKQINALGQYGSDDEGLDFGDDELPVRVLH